VEETPSQEAERPSELPSPISIEELPVRRRPATAMLVTGETVGGRYRVLERIGKGGMGEVYAAKDLDLEDRVALKVIRTEGAEDPSLLERFKREIVLARRISHPNVCRVFDGGVYRRTDGDEAQEIRYLTMEMLDGETLTRRIERKGRISTGVALGLVRQMASGLAAAHAAGVVHRDLKSDNIFLVSGPSGQTRVVITDFGLARNLQIDDKTSITEGFIGTPAYMSPEQVDGSHPVTPASDLYSLGVVLYEMITGLLPFGGGTPLAVAQKRLTHSPIPPSRYVPELEPRWEISILRCLSREPQDRYATPEELIDALHPTRPSHEHARLTGNPSSREHARLANANTPSREHARLANTNAPSREHARLAAANTPSREHARLANANAPSREPARLESASPPSREHERLGTASAPSREHPRAEQAPFELPPPVPPEFSRTTDEQRQTEETTQPNLSDPSLGLAPARRARRTGGWRLAGAAILAFFVAAGSVGLLFRRSQKGHTVLLLPPTRCGNPAFVCESVQKELRDHLRNDSIHIISRAEMARVWEVPRSVPLSTLDRELALRELGAQVVISPDAIQCEPGLCKIQLHVQDASTGDESSIEEAAADPEQLGQRAASKLLERLLPASR